MSRSNSRTVYEILGRDSVHPFPARMAPGLALDVVAKCTDPLRVLDPMSGSGTVLAVARSKGHHAIGVDIDPLAVLISRVWTTPVDPNTVRKQAVEILDQAHSLLASLQTHEAYPKNSDTETQHFAKYWFDDQARRQLASLATVIQKVQDDTTRDALWCAFSRLIITKKSGASLAMDLSHSRPHRVFERAPSEPFPKFLSAVNRVVRNCIDSSNSNAGPATHVYEGDARKLAIKDGSVDLVLTSPPYLNAIDYIRCSKFSLIWMGYSIERLRRIRSTSVGAEIGKYARDNQRINKVLSKLKLRPKLAKRQEAVLARYIGDMQGAIDEAARVLTDKGQAVYVVGENTIRGTFIPNSAIVEAVANMAGLQCITRRSRELPANRRYLPPPDTQSETAALNGRMRREVILTFRKVA